MNAIQKAASEALQFLFTSTGQHFQQKRILIIQGPPENYLEAFQQCHIDVIHYDALIEPLWNARQIPTNRPLEGYYDLVIHFAAKSENETKLHLNLALQHLAPTGDYIGIAHNKMGPSRFHKHLNGIFQQVESLSKSKCRVFSAQRCDATQQPDWGNLNQPSEIGSSGYLSLPGVYGEKAIDAGSALLAETLKNEHWSGVGADIGCGFGFLTGEILKTRHRIKQIYLYDSDSRALAMAQLNLANQTELKPHWVDVTKQIPVDRPVHWAVMNPPFHSGISQDHGIGQKFITQAASILRPGCPLFMVSNLHLPYEKCLFDHFRSVVKLQERDGFKCFKAIK